MRRLLYFAFLLAAAIACCGLLYGAYAVARQEARANLIQQQSILARQAAVGIQDFFAHTKNLASALASNPHIIDIDSEGAHHLDTVLTENRPGLRSITRMDEHGRILFATPDNSIIGRNLAGQEHVRRVLAERAPTVSEVFQTMQGFSAVSLHVPVFSNGRFRGSLALLIAFDVLSRRYLEGVRVAESGESFVLSRRGVVLYASQDPGLVGKTAQEFTRGSPQLRGVVERMLAGETGTADFSDDRAGGHDVQVLKHALFLPAHIDNTYWSLCVATPDSELLAGLRRFAKYLLPLGTAILLLTALGVALGLRHFVLEREVMLRRESEAALRESEARHRSVVENISDAFYRTDAEGRIVMVSPSGLRMVGFDREEELLGEPMDSLWHRPEERRKLLDALQESGEVRDYELNLVNRRTGEPIHVSTSSVLRRNSKGEVLGVEGTFRDVSERMRAREALVESERRFHSLFDNMAEGAAMHTLVRDAAGKVVDYRIETVNASFERIFGLEAGAVAGKLATEAFGLSVAPNLQAVIEVAATGRPFVLEFHLPSLGKHLSLSAVPWIDGGFAALFVDITERKQMEEQLLFRALHDPLTGLANRTLCLDRIAQAAERARRRPPPGFAVVFIDLDRFKVINDSLGHEAGDQLLREVASRLLACTRRMDTVCRYGGDEFTLVLEELSAREVLRTLRRIRASLKDPVLIGTHSIQVEASFGLAYPPLQPCGPEDILRNANIALHRAKQHGRNRAVVYKPSMHAAAIQIMSLESDMRRGLDLGEFALVYQPIVDLSTGRLRGFEALLRWRHPTRGTVPPGQFVPVAEECGLIFELGGFALNRACLDMAAMLARNPSAAGLTMSVNLSPRQFSRQGLSEQIDSALSVSGLAPSALVLEITESSIMKHPESSSHILTRLKDRGVGVAIDDFGTGYSSMSALQRLPLDRLKIDMSFVSRITGGADDREIVRAIITLARSLRLATVAEGIETPAQRDILRELGCDMGQGYLFARPVPLEHTAELIDASGAGEDAGEAA